MKRLTTTKIAKKKNEWTAEWQKRRKKKFFFTTSYDKYKANVYIHSEKCFIHRIYFNTRWREMNEPKENLEVTINNMFITSCGIIRKSIIHCLCHHTILMRLCLPMMPLFGSARYSLQT